MGLVESRLRCSHQTNQICTHAVSRSFAGSSPTVKRATLRNPRQQVGRSRDRSRPSWFAHVSKRHRAVAQVPDPAETADVDLTRVRLDSSKCAPPCVHYICCFPLRHLTNGLTGAAQRPSSTQVRSRAVDTSRNLRQSLNEINCFFPANSYVQAVHVLHGRTPVTGTVGKRRAGAKTWVAAKGQTWACAPLC
jgi:hypothetical protein